MSMIKEYQRQLVEGNEVDQINQQGQQPPTARHNLRPGDMAAKLNSLATDVDEIHMKVAEIVKANPDQYEDSVNLGAQDGAKQVQKAVWALERALQDWAGEIDHVNTAEYE